MTVAREPMHTPAEAGHFLLESGCHTDAWLTLDVLFLEPIAIAPLVDTLAAQLRAHAPTAICGCMVGGAFLAQALATTAGLRFYFTELAAPVPSSGLFAAAYRLPPPLAARIRGERVAVVDDVISAGSSARATVRAVRDAGAAVVAVGALMTLGAIGIAHFADEGIAVETIERRAFNMWTPGECPMCRAGQPLERRV
jgi:orotate phosphoribosyltransferase